MKVFSVIFSGASDFLFSLPVGILIAGVAQKRVS